MEDFAPRGQMLLLLARETPLRYTDFRRRLGRPSITIWKSLLNLQGKGLIMKDRSGGYTLTPRGYFVALQLHHRRMNEAFDEMVEFPPISLLPEERKFLGELAALVLQVPFERLLVGGLAAGAQEFGETAKRVDDELVPRGPDYDKAVEKAEEAGTLFFVAFFHTKELTDEVYHLQRALTAIVKPGPQSAQRGLEVLDQARSMVEERLKAGARPAFRVILEDLSRRLAEIEETKKALEAEEARLQDLLTALKGFLQASAGQFVPTLPNPKISTD